MKSLLFYAVPAHRCHRSNVHFIKFNWVSRQDAGDRKMSEISTYIAEGAMAFLRAEWKILSYFVVIVAILLGVMAQCKCKLALVYCHFLYHRCRKQRTCRLHRHEDSHQSQRAYGSRLPEQSCPKL